jgi:hypothetical protein
MGLFLASSVPDMDADRASNVMCTVYQNRQNRVIAHMEDMKVCVIIFLGNIKLVRVH